MEHTKKLILLALFAALTCAATFVIKIPTPTFGYIHPGDAFVLLSGAILGPLYGALAAGIGSALSDLFAGYMVYVPATAIIKALCAATAGFFVRIGTDSSKKSFQGAGKEASHSVFLNPLFMLIIGGSISEIIMVLGYFLFEIFLLGFAEGTTAGDYGTAISSGIIAAAASLPFNIVQGIFGVVTASLLYPLLSRIIRSSSE